jgi:hypothetical protein
VTVTNSGSAAAQFTGLTVSGDFALVGPPALPAPLAPGARITFDVTFTPTAPGPRQGKVTVTDGGGRAQDISLSGTGTPPAAPAGTG